MRSSKFGNQSLKESVQWKRPLAEVVIILIGAMVLSLVGIIRSTPVAHAAVCTPQHCYGITEWTGANIGVSETHKTVGLFSINDGYNHISNEEWDIDTSTQCTLPDGSGSGAAWEETGEATRRGSTGNWYFWVECPTDGFYTENFLYQPPSGDVGKFFYYDIYQVSQPHQDFAYRIEMYLSGTNTLIWGATTSINDMTPTLIETGLETTNNSYSVTHSDPDLFYYSQYKSGSDLAWHYQTTVGNFQQSNPPNWYWIVTPVSGNRGGEGQTTCC